MSKTQQRSSSHEEGFSSYQPKTASKSVIITRTRGPSSSSVRSSGSYGSSFSSQRISMSVNPAVYSQIAGTGINDFRGNRQKEKKDMQDLNERLANYIEQNRWLEAETNRLRNENEQLRNRTDSDWRPIKDMYAGELEQARKIISELSAQKGIEEGKVANLEDEIQSLREIIAQHENDDKDRCKKIDALNSQIGDYEGELTTLRLRCNSLEEELARLRALLQKYKDQITSLRQDVDNETAAHIQQEVEAKTTAEECEFLRDLLDKLELCRPEPVTIKGMNTEDYFKGELRRAVQGIQQSFDDKLEQCQMEMEQKYATQMNQLRSGNVRDTMEADHAKNESKRLREQLEKTQSDLANLRAMLASTKADLDSRGEQLRLLTEEHERHVEDSARMKMDMSNQIEALMAEMRALMDAKMSLELEITCYKKLLEGEENRTGLRQLVEQSIGVQSSGAASLADMIGQSSITSSTTARTTVQRTSKGNILFHSVEPTGKSITLENNQSKNQILSKWYIKKLVNGEEPTKTVIPDIEIPGGGVVVLYSNSANKRSTTLPNNEKICPILTWGTGDGKFVLCDADGAEKATLTVRVQF